MGQVFGAHYSADHVAYHKNTGRIRSKVAELRDRDGRRLLVVHTPYIALESVASPIIVEWDAKGAAKARASSRI